MACTWALPDVLPCSLLLMHAEVRPPCLLHALFPLSLVQKLPGEKAVCHTAHTEGT